MSAPKPVPVPDDFSEGFWTAAARGVLAIQRCDHCQRYAHPPRVVCTGCQASDAAFSFEPVSGRGTVRSWTVLQHAFLPGFEADVPYVLVDVELDEQPELRMVARLLDRPDDALAVGERVEVVFTDVAPGVAVPAFALIERMP